MLLASFFVVGQHLMMHLYGINKLIPSEVLFAGVADFFITFFVVGFLLLANKKRIRALMEKWSKSYQRKNHCLIIYFLNVFFFLIIIYYSKGFISLIFQGVTRQALFNEYGGYPFLLSVADKYFLVASVFIFFSSASKKLVFLTVLGFALSTVIMTSRSNLMFFLMFVFIYNLLDFRPSRMVALTRFLLLFVLIALFFGVYVQNRSAQSVFLGPLKPVEDLFLYQSYSMYLAKVSSTFASEHNKLVYPFLGYFSDYWYRFFGGTNLVGSDFVMRFHVFQSDVRQHSANVLYPWWSWFYGAYGYSGLIVKAIYVYFLLRISLIMRLLPVFLLLLYWSLFSGYTKMPFLTLDAFITLFFVLIIALIPRVKMRRKLSECNYISRCSYS